ncbi:MAG: hypothetical protein JNK12_04570 [Acidimicrobiales bacterium]|nr:hypothetical protein [Acidimicrobiales bacterium]
MADVTFLADGGMDFAVRCVLSGAPYATAEPGEVLAVVAEVVDGDPSSWRDTWLARGRALATAAASDAAAGRPRSACGGALRAANYLFAGNYYAPACTDAAGARSVWAEHRAAWDLAVSCWPTPAALAAIDTPAGTLPGYWFAGAAPAGERRPVVVLIGGIETPMSDAPMTGLTDALARGYRVLLLDGPGQGAALYDGGLTLAPRWDDVWPAVLDGLAAQPGVDADRVCLMGINHGGLWAAQGAAIGGDRVAALVLDPAVTGLVDDVVAGLPEELAALWRSQPEALDRAVADRAASDADLAFWVAKTLDPFPGGGGVRAALDALAAAVLTEADLAAVASPTLVCVAEHASAFVGQADPVLAALGPRATRLDFTAAEGAGLDCEIGAPQVRNARVYDRLDALFAG